MKCDETGKEKREDDERFTFFIFYLDRLKMYYAYDLNMNDAELNWVT